MKKNSHNSEYTPEDYKNNDFGMVVSSFEEIRKHQDEYAAIFAEGSPRLKKLLNHLWNHGIETVGCCIGHKDALVTYYKFHLIKPFEEISKEEYEIHKNSWRYFTEKKDKTPYFAFRPIREVSVEEQVLSIQESLKEKWPDFDCFVDANKTGNMITIIQNSFLPEVMREHFFNTLTDVLDQHLVKTKQLQKEAGKDEQASRCQKTVDEQIKDAQKKQGGQMNHRENKTRELINRTDAER